MSSKLVAPDLDQLYAVLRQWAIEQEPQTYAALSHAHRERTGDWFEPHGSWDRPLGALNNRLAAIGAPALSALVILQLENEPGAAFWACAPNVPRRSNDPVARIVAWDRIVKAVCSYAWPERLPPSERA